MSRYSGRYGDNRDDNYGYPPYVPVEKTYFLCAECGKQRAQGIVRPDQVCQYCRAAKRKPKNTVVKLSDELVITSTVQKRLIKKAKANTPKAQIIKIIDTLPAYLIPIFCISAIPLSSYLGVSLHWSYWALLIFIIGAFGVPSLIIFFYDLLLENNDCSVAN